MTNNKDEERIKNITKNIQQFMETEEKASIKLKDLEKKLTNLENYMLRPENNNIGEIREHKRMMEEYIRKGSENPLLTKALGKGEGELLITPTLHHKIVGAIKEKSIMRSLASCETISTNALDIVTERENLAAGWVDEEEERKVTDTQKLSIVKIPVHELYAQPKATQRLLDDSAINIEDWLVERLADSFAASENEAFIKGDGRKKPSGILTNPNIYVIKSEEEGPSLELLLNMINSLPEEHLANATFLMNRTTLSFIQSLKDKEGRFIWQASFSDLFKQTILGVPVVCSSHIPELNKGPSLILANFKAAYKIVDRSEMQLMRDPYTEKPFVKFYTTKRVGGGVVDPKAAIFAEFRS